jgi:hypothetical protein
MHPDLSLRQLRLPNMIGFLVLLLPAAVLSADLPCSTNLGHGASFLNSIADASSGIIDSTIYIFPHVCVQSHSDNAPCHYYCDQTNNLGWQSDLNSNNTISWSGAASAVGELEDGSEALFMMGGGPHNKPLADMVYYSPKAASKTGQGLVTLPPLRYGALALAAAAYMKPNVYLLGGVGTKFYNEKIYRFDTTTLTWLTDNLTPSGSFTPRIGLSASILNGVIVAAGGHTGTGGSSRYTAAFELLEVDRSSTFVVCGLWCVVRGVWWFVVIVGGV